MMIRVILLLFTVAIFSCSSGVPNRLSGNSYMVVPLNSFTKLRLDLNLTTVVHKYKSNSTCEIITFVGRDVNKRERMSYSLTGNTYEINGELYDLDFRGDTILMSIEGSPVFKLEPIK